MNEPMPAESTAAVIAAVVGNLAAALAKAAAAVFTGSAAMLSETIHSLVDAGNDGLILLGAARSRKPPDHTHPFGHGRELYFWTLIVGIVIFAVGGGMSVYEGILRVLHPVPVGNLAWSYAVLGVSALFDGWSWVAGWKAFRRERRGRGIFETIHVSKDPTSFSVFLEDSAALAGLLLAFVGTAVGHWLGAHWLDGLASIGIGLLLCCVAFVMVFESRGLLIGEGVEHSTLEGIRDVLRADPAVERCGRLLTVYLGPEEVLLTVEIAFRGDCTARDIRDAIGRLKRSVQTRYPRIRRIYFDADSVVEPGGPPPAAPPADQAA